jgi:LPXTG-site transpeptidase (sortase) family protein
VANRRFLVLSQKIDQSKQVNVSAQENQLLVKPIKLYIPKLSKILAVSDGQVINNRWIISETGVSYLTSSVLPGKVGNSVFYGHNKAEILGGLPRLAAGDLIYVVLDNGEFAKYQVFETKEVSPNQVQILNDSDEARLTIYTCSGFLDQARFVVVARLI